MREVNMPLFIGIAGGSGSGKTTVAKNIKQAFSNDERVVIIEMDSYYKDLSGKTLAEREKNNYDIPDAIDFPLLRQQLADLKANKAVKKPIYDFVTHSRKQETELIEPADIIVLEGIMTFHDEKVRNMLDIKFFVDTDADIRLMRRIRRDMEQRGRSFEEIRERYFTMVRPAYRDFVKPTMRFADLVIPEGGQNSVAIDIIVSKISHWLSDKEKSAKK
ncbi:uridine kinase [bacterium]|nr:uridine kinase [bacterium]MBQ4438606.1 uridine kinase [bacterium]